MTEPVNVTTEPETTTDGEGDSDRTEVVTENGRTDGDADLTPNH